MDFNFKEKPNKYTFDDLLNIVKTLRAPGGCPWDREQTHDSIKKNLIEEGYELIEAIDSGVPEKIADESGDMLLQVVFHAIIGEDCGEYNIDDVTDAISRKLIHRHPHVFGTVNVSDSDEVLKNWDAIKRLDRAQDSIADEMRGISKYLPTTIRCEKVQKKAEKAGYTFLSDRENTTQDECGKLLFLAVNACRKSGIDPEIALSGYLDNFIDEFEAFEKLEK